MSPSRDEATGKSPWPRRLASFAIARLRFVVVVVAALLVVGGWETIRLAWDRLIARPSSEGAISSSTEYFCPMDPGILSDWAAKCPICQMTLVRRRKGEAAPLPEGVVARMQFTPYRLWLGGIETSPIEYAALVRWVEAPGVVMDDGASVRCDFFADELEWVQAANHAEVETLEGPNAGLSLSAMIRSMSDDAQASVVLGVESLDLRPGERVRARLACPIDALAPFRDSAGGPPPLTASEPRKVYRCMEHREVLLERAGRCPRDQSTLMAVALRDDQRVRWWCPMHPEVTAEQAGAKCERCGGMVLVPRLLSYRPRGQALSVPVSAVVHEAGRSLVFVGRGEGTFDATPVRLGPRCGDTYAVVDGLVPGDRVATRGAFLIEAESRLNPSVAAAFFGAGPGGKHTEASEKAVTGDLALIERQHRCPVTGKVLGSMGGPVKLDVRGRIVFLCCAGCKSAIEADPDKYLAKLPNAARP